MRIGWIATPIAATVLLLYWGFCWGWWGRENLFLTWALQYLTPPITEEHRYPARVDVIASAWYDPDLRGISPGGRYLLIEYRRLSFWPSSRPIVYLMDLQTGEQTPTELEDGGFFLSETELLTFVDRKPMLVDLLQQTSVPLQRVADEDGSDLATTVAHFRVSDRVILHTLYDGSADVIGLAADSTQHPERNMLLTFRRYEKAEQIVKALESHNIPFTRMRRSCDSNVCVSHAGDLLAVGGIYTNVGNKVGIQLVPDFYSDQRPFQVSGWVYDDSGIILSLPADQITVIGTPGSLFAALTVPQPILKLKTPTEYLTPEARERERAQQFKEMIGTIVAWSVPLVVAALYILQWWRGRPGA